MKNVPLYETIGMFRLCLRRRGARGQDFAQRPAAQIQLLGRTGDIRDHQVVRALVEEEEPLDLAHDRRGRKPAHVHDPLHGDAFGAAEALNLGSDQAHSPARVLLVQGEDGEDRGYPVAQDSALVVEADRNGNHGPHAKRKRLAVAQEVAAQSSSRCGQDNVVDGRSVSLLGRLQVVQRNPHPVGTAARAALAIQHRRGGRAGDAGETAQRL